MQGFVEFAELEEAKTPAQKMDFKRMMSGAMSRKEYNEKYPKKVDSTKKLDKTGVYKNLIKTNEEVELEEEKKITIKTKMGGEIPGTIKVTGKDYHIVKSDVGGKQYKTDHQGNALEEDVDQSLYEGRKPEKDDHEPHPRHGDIGLTKGDARDAAYAEGERHGAGNKHGSNAKAWGPEAKHYNAGFMSARNDSDKWHKKMSKITRTEETDKDLPFTPDKKKTKPSTPGKYGDAYSTVRNLARKALARQKVKAVDEELEEAFINGREYASHGLMHPTHADMPIHAKTGKHIDFYASKTGDKMQGKVVKNDGKEVHIQAHSDKEMGDGKLHKFKVSSQLPVKEETELQEETQAHKVSVTVSDPNHTMVSQRKEKIQKRVVVSATDKGEALAKAKKFYQKRGYKVHDVEHHSMVPKTTMKTEEANLEEGAPKTQYGVGWMLRADPELKKKVDANTAGHKALKKYAGKDLPKKEVKEGYRGNSEADKPFFDAQDHKQAAVKAGNAGDNFSYHMHMAAHHDSMAHWSSNKGRHHVADQHMNKAEQHEHDAQQYRKGAK